ncbi:L-rhamnose/proton symporter RhaT [Reichenbachiella versicolor]|uniref:L-rhamnose/proton symporter RhaT n=1 Tax=Reichenbachiella versicolor TaxID=1821036 RepID=UPI000D6E8D4A|nr:L-rhamnose/proton symporter RhaT [Reichenbachiella versicolor]
MDSFAFGLTLLVFASFFQGTFGLGMKYTEPLKWEAWWLVHATTAMILLPILAAMTFVPNLFDVIAATPADVKMYAMIFGAAWGIGGIMFGKCVPYIGMSLTYGIVLGLCAIVGSLIPYFTMEQPDMTALPKVLGGDALLLIGVGVAAYAGIMKDKMTGDSNQSNLKVGLIIAIISGVMSAMLGIGFSEGLPIRDIAADVMAKDQTDVDMGANLRNGSLAVWVVVLWGGFAINAFYAIFLLFKNNSWGSFATLKSGKAYTWSIIAALTWFGALAIYGQGVSMMGDIGPVIGWPMLMGGGLIVSNVWAYRSGEWDGVAKPFKVLLFGIALIIVATIVMA